MVRNQTTPPGGVLWGFLVLGAALVPLATVVVTRMAGNSGGAAGAAMRSPGRDTDPPRLVRDERYGKIRV